MATHEITLQSSIGTVGLFVGEDSPEDRPRVGVRVDGSICVWLDVLCDAQVWRADPSCYYSVDRVESTMPPELQRELLALATEWADANPGMFREVDRQQFFDHFEGCAELYDEAADVFYAAREEYMPVLAEVDEVLSNRWSQLTTPAELRAATKARDAIAHAETVARQAIAEIEAGFA